LDGNEINAIIQKIKQCSPSKTSVFIPRFKIEYGTSLISQFQSLGMQKAFSAKFADFGKITGKRNAPGLVWIAQIQHKAFLEINEEGGEAAAATAVEVSTRSAKKLRVFNANRPFIFFITDTVTDSILFTGRVTNPVED